MLSSAQLGHFIVAIAKQNPEARSSLLSWNNGSPVFLCIRFDTPDIEDVKFVSRSVQR